MPLRNVRLVILFVFIGIVFGRMQSSFDRHIILYSLQEIKSRSLVDPDEKLLITGAIDGMVRKLSTELEDPHSMYIPPNSEKERIFNEHINNRFEGIGVRFHPNNKKGHPYRVFFPMPGSPAAKAGIRAGDEIVKVDDMETAEMDFSEISKKIRGEPGSSVKLSVLHRGESEPVELEVKRSTIQQWTVFGDTLKNDGSQNFMLESNPEIAYIRISQFTSETDRELRDAILSLPKSARGLILDLRGNPGGNLDTCVNIADMFVQPTGQYKDIVTTRNKAGVIRQRLHATMNVLTHLPMVVLIDGESASASEIVSGCLQDFNRARIVGMRSFGKGTVQEVIPLPMGWGQLKLTTRSFWRPSDRNINRLHNMDESDTWGVSPDPGLEVKMDVVERIALECIRSIRSNVKASEMKTELNAFLAEGLDGSLVKQLKTEEANEDEENGLSEDEFLDPSEEEEQPDEIPLEIENETISENDEMPPYIPEGNPPYYDPQLEKAIEVLCSELPASINQSPKEL